MNRYLCTINDIIICICMLCTFLHTISISNEKIKTNNCRNASNCCSSVEPNSNNTNVIGISLPKTCVFHSTIIHSIACVHTKIHVYIYSKLSLRLLVMFLCRCFVTIPKTKKHFCMLFTWLHVASHYPCLSICRTSTPHTLGRISSSAWLA